MGSSQSGRFQKGSGGQQLSSQTGSLPFKTGELERMAKKFVQKLYKTYTKIIQNTKFVYILYAKLVQIKILYNNECTNNVHRIPTYIQKMYKLYKTCKKLRLKTA